MHTLMVMTRKVMSHRVRKCMPFFCNIFQHCGDYIRSPHPFFVCTGVYKVILQSREVSFNVGRLLFKPLPQGPLRLCVYYHQFSLHTYLLFMIHLLCQNCFVCMWPCVVQRLYGWSTCATPHWRWYSRYLMRWLALGVATAGRRVAQSVTQCSVPSSGLEGRAVMLYDRHKVKLCF